MHVSFCCGVRVSFYHSVLVRDLHRELNLYIYIRPDFLRENLSSMSASWKAREPEPAAKKAATMPPKGGKEEKDHHFRGGRAGYKSLKKKVQYIAPEQVAAARDFGREAGIDAGRVPAPGAPGALVLQAAEEAAAKLQDTMLKKNNDSQSNHLLNPSEFPRLSRGGGTRKGKVSATKKVLEVFTDTQGIALYAATDRYLNLADNLRKLLKQKEIKTTHCKYVHPLLLCSGAELTEIQVRSIANELLKHQKNPVVGFRKLLCTFAIRSKTNRKNKNVTWTFDPEAWNREGYRITVGGDCKGGKPQVKLVPSDARLTTPAAPAAAPVLPAPHSRIPGSAFSRYVSKARSDVRALKAVAGPQALPPE